MTQVHGSRRQAALPRHPPRRTMEGSVQAENVMLHSLSVTTMLPVKDLQRARTFYEVSLGLGQGTPQPDGKVLYHCGSAQLALFPKDGGTRAEHTAVSFEVDDIHAAIADLESRGVRFEDYDLPGLRTERHVCVLGAEKAAWFMDSEGNCLCLHETVH
jgi:catechol 2,3-dioxygenase-like lactoylglutathione lyase family enzyme